MPRLFLLYDLLCGLGIIHRGGGVITLLQEEPAFHVFPCRDILDVQRDRFLILRLHPYAHCACGNVQPTAEVCFCRLKIDLNVHLLDVHRVDVGKVLVVKDRGVRNVCHDALDGIAVGNGVGARGEFRHDDADLHPARTGEEIANGSIILGERLLLGVVFVEVDRADEGNTVSVVIEGVAADGETVLRARHLVVVDDAIEVPPIGVLRGELRLRRLGKGRPAVRADVHLDIEFPDDDLAFKEGAGGQEGQQRDEQKRDNDKTSRDGQLALFAYDSIIRSFHQNFTCGTVSRMVLSTSKNFSSLNLKTEAMILEGKRLTSTLYFCTVSL